MSVIGKVIQVAGPAVDVEFPEGQIPVIRTAIRNQLERHADVVRQSVSRHSLDLGLRHYGRDRGSRREMCSAR